MPDEPFTLQVSDMTMHQSLTSLTLRVLSAFFAAVCILASVNAYADDTVFLYYGETLKAQGVDVGTVLNSAQGNILHITGTSTHNQKVAIGVLTINGNGGNAQKINVQSLDPNAPYVFTKPTDDLQLYMTNIEYCGNADQNVRSIFVKDQYTGSSSSSMAMIFHDVTVSSFNAPDSEAYSVFNISNTITGITLLSDDGHPNTFSNNRGCARARAINFNPASTANDSTGDWRFINNYATNGSVLNCYQLLLKDEGKYTFTGNSATLNGGAIYSTINYDGTGTETSEAMCHLNDNDLTLNFENNVAGVKGGAIYGYESEVRISGENTFINNRAGISLDGNNVASGKGGAICCETTLSSRYYPNYKMGYVYLSDCASKFESNLASGDGGAIYSEGRVDFFENTSVKFLNNIAGYVFTDESTGDNSYKASGGAIYSKEYVYIETSPSEFSENSAYYGGAIYSESYTRVQESPSEFSKNSAYYGGAIYTKGNARIQESTATLSENSAYSGGAIYSESRVLIPYNTSVKFYKNVAEYASIDESTGEYIYQQGSGGAIFSKRDTYIVESSTEFSENSAYYGGAIYSERFVEIENSPIAAFSKNTAHYGGAIYSEPYVLIESSPVTFSMNKANQGGAIYTKYLDCSGDATTATFTGNYGAFYDAVNDKVCGNDLYLPVNDNYDPNEYVCTNLAIYDKGTYSFDGGIYIELGAYSGNPNNTVINKSQVTIAGRANDSTNYYQLRRANIFNGGKLTAKLDEIEGVNGIFVMDDNSAKLELNVTGDNTKKLTMDAQDVTGPAHDGDLAVQGSGVIEKTGDGTLQILAAAEGLVRAESFVVSSGRLDYRGYFTGSVEVGGSEAEAVFSPGNSVGDAYVDGNVSILNSGVALFEFGAFPGRDSDSNHDVLYITDGNFSAGNQMISLYFEEADEANWSYEGCKYLLVSGANLPKGDYTRWLDGDFTGLFSLLSESNNLYLVYPLPEPTPEPSTIALLLLGVAGLMYMRKRKN